MGQVPVRTRDEMFVAEVLKPSETVESSIDSILPFRRVLLND